MLWKNVDLTSTDPSKTSVYNSKKFQSRPRVIKKKKKFQSSVEIIVEINFWGFNFRSQVEPPPRAKFIRIPMLN